MLDGPVGEWPINQELKNSVVGLECYLSNFGAIGIISRLCEKMGIYLKIMEETGDGSYHTLIKATCDAREGILW